MVMTQSWSRSLQVPEGNFGHLEVPLRVPDTAIQSTRRQLVQTGRGRHSRRLRCLNGTAGCRASFVANMGGRLRGRLRLWRRRGLLRCSWRWRNWILRYRLCIVRRAGRRCWGLVPWAGHRGCSRSHNVRARRTRRHRRWRSLSRHCFLNLCSQAGPGHLPRVTRRFLAHAAHRGGPVLDLSMVHALPRDCACQVAPKWRPRR